MNAARMLGMTASRQKKTAEKLSSGYRINRASDDAAGLSISEKMRRQIRGLDRGSTNSNDGISLAQTAEGALAEVHDMLHRMSELSIQAANETLSRGDRQAIQAEVDQILTEIDRVSETTKFNEEYLLKGGTGTEKRYVNIHDAGLSGVIANTTDGPGHGAFVMKRLQEGDGFMIAGRNYTLGSGKADVQNAINTTGVAGDTVVINDNITYHIIDPATGPGGQVAPAKQASEIAGQINSSTRKVSIDGNSEVYSLIDGYGTAKTAGTVANMVTGTTSSVTISGDNNGHNGTYTLLSGGYRAELRGNIANGIGSSTYNVTIGGTTYHLKNSNGYVATLKSDIANMAFSASTISFGGNTYTLRSGGAVAETKSNIQSNLSSQSLPSIITITDASANTMSLYQVISDSDTVDSTAIPQQINLSNMNSAIGSLANNSTVKIGSNTYSVQNYNAASVSSQLASVADNTEVLVNGSGKYLAESVVKSVSQLQSEINNASSTSLGTNVSITGPSGTSSFTVRDYNASTVRGYISGASVGAGDRATTSVSIDGNTYALRDYDLNTVKSRVNGYGTSEYDDSTTVGKVISVDGAEYTAETEYFRQAICIAYGEDQQTDVSALGAGDDDVIQGGGTVTFKGITYKLMLDRDNDGYDDDDHFVVTEGRAYKIIAKELERASSIGATDSPAVVKDKNNNAIVDGVTMAADFIEDPNNTLSLVRFEIDKGSMSVVKDMYLNIHAGTDADMNNKIGINIQAMSTQGLGLKNLNLVDDIGISATYAIDAIDDAIAIVSSQRSELGAVQNRMEHTIRNLDNIVENTTSAESRLRDADIADEMVALSKDNILAQAGQAMLAQANKTSESVMSLLS